MNAAMRNLALALSLALGFAAGCSRPPGLPLSPELLETRREVRRDFRLVGWSVEARPIFAHTFGDGEETVMLVSGLHGDAPAGPRVLRQFMTHLVEHPALLAGRRVVIVPSLNPDGRARRTRHNARDVDLDRNFPTANWRALAHCGPQGASEPETAALLLAVANYRPSRVLQVRSPLFRVTPLGDARTLARRLARASGHPFVPTRFPPPSGSLASWLASDRGIPAVILDLRSREPYADLWAEVHPALEVFVRGQ